MANTTSRIRGAAARAARLTHGQGCWIRFQLNLRGIDQGTAAEKAGVAKATVSDFLNGRNNSERVREVLREILGYRTFAELLAAAKCCLDKGGAA